MQLAAIIVSLVLTVVGVALLARAVAQIYRFRSSDSPYRQAAVRTVRRHERSPWSGSSSATAG